MPDDLDLTAELDAAEHHVLGLKLAKARKQRGWSLREAERHSGVPNAHISQIETGTIMRPEAATLIRLADAYDLPTAELISFVPGGAGGNSVNFVNAEAAAAFAAVRAGQDTQITAVSLGFTEEPGRTTLLARVADRRREAGELTRLRAAWVDTGTDKAREEFLAALGRVTSKAVLDDLEGRDLDPRDPGPIPIGPIWRDRSQAWVRTEPHTAGGSLPLGVRLACHLAGVAAAIALGMLAAVLTGSAWVAASATITGVFAGPAWLTRHLTPRPGNVENPGLRNRRR